MTRINVIPPGDLTDEHLLAEWRELPRVFTLARADDGRPTPPTTPPPRPRTNAMALRIYIGPDEQAHGCCIATLSTEDGDDTLDAWRSTGPRPGRDGRVNTWDWLTLARRRLTLPRDVKRAGLKWDDADVQPYGWSPGGAYAPNGVTIIWMVGE